MKGDANLFDSRKHSYVKVYRLLRKEGVMGEARPERLV